MMKSKTDQDESLPRAGGLSIGSFLIFIILTALFAGRDYPDAGKMTIDVVAAFIAWRLVIWSTTSEERSHENQ